MSRNAWSRTLSMGVTALLATVVLAACVTPKVTGGGWIYSAVDDGSKATFSFSANLSCKGSTSLVECGPNDLSFRGNGSYHDKAAGVKFSFDGAFGDNVDDDEQVYFGVIQYTSQDKQNPGGGIGCVVLVDGGEGGKLDEGDFVYIGLGGLYDDEPDNEFEALCQRLLPGSVGSVSEDDPFDGYKNSGGVNGGNVQVHIKKKDVEG